MSVLQRSPDLQGTRKPLILGQWQRTLNTPDLQGETRASSARVFGPCERTRGSRQFSFDLADSVAPPRVDSPQKGTTSCQRRTSGPSVVYDLLYRGKAYPLKGILGLVTSLITGTPIRLSDFSGGDRPGQTNAVLRSLGFDIVRKIRPPRHQGMQRHRHQSGWR